MIFKSFFLCAVLSLSLGSISQNNLTGYEYWFNEDYSARITQPLSSADAVISDNVPSSLPEGINVMNIRAFDQNYLFSSVLSTFFFKTTIQTSLSKQISSYTYWFDEDFVNAQTVSVTPQENIVLTELLPTNNLTNGFHTFHIRFKDNSGLVSGVTSRHFYKTPGSASQNNTIAKYEYWIDTNFSNATEVTTSNQQYIDITSSLDLSQTTNGLHTFNIRFQDINGVWSSVMSQQLFKVNESTNSQKDIVSYARWFDDDYQNATTSTLTNASYIFLNDLISTTGLSNGLHTINLQFRDNAGAWSSVSSTHFYQSPVTPNNNGKITAYRYWIENNFSDTTHVVLNNPVTDAVLIDDLDFTMVPKDTYALHFQFKDELERWSSVTTDTIVKTPLPIPIFNADSLAFCDSATVSFTNTSMDGDAYIWDFGDGTTSQDTLPVHSYGNPGIYDVSLTVIDSITLTDSTVVYSNYIEVFETPSSTIDIINNDSICEGESVELVADQNAVYLWSTNETSQSIQVDTAGQYWVYLENDQLAACNTQSDTVSITVMPLPIADYDFTTNDFTVDFDNLSENGDSYYWHFDDGNSSTDLNPTHIYGTNGLYDSYLVAYNWCGADTSFATIDLSDVGITEFNDKLSFSYFPNPTSENVTLQFDSPQTKVSTLLLDAKGKQVGAKNYSDIPVADIIVQLPKEKGVYYLLLETNDFREMVKLIKH